MARSTYASRIALLVVTATVAAEFGEAFTIRNPVLGDPPVHETITEEAMRRVLPGVSPVVVEYVVEGTTNPDTALVTHKLDNDYHINDATADPAVENRQFLRSFTLLHALVDRATQRARDNPQVLQPLHDTVREALADVRDSAVDLRNSGACLESPDCPTLSLTELSVAAGAASFGPAHPDPHSDGAVVDIVRAKLAAANERLNDYEARGADRARVTRLVQLERELNAYVARQLLGHAFHILQDFFAHSNFVEIANGRAGPPCGGLGNPAICDAAVQGLPSRFADPDVGVLLLGLRDDFGLNLALLQAALGDRFDRLQTGFVGLMTGGDFCPDTAPNLVPGAFNYCHWPGDSVPGLNKDQPGTRNPSHANHGYARALALFATEILWEKFLLDANLVQPPALAVRLPDRAEGSAPSGKRRAAASRWRDIEVRLADPARLRARFDYRIEAMGEAAGGTNCSGDADFVLAEGTASIEPGQTMTRIPVRVCADLRVEGDERFRVVIVNARYARLANGAQLLPIEDDDRYPAPVLLSMTPAAMSQPQLMEGGSILTLTGRGFAEASRVEIDGQALTTSFHGSTRLTALIPMTLSAGSRQVRVVTPAPGGGSSAIRTLQIQSLLDIQPPRTAARDAVATAAVAAAKLRVFIGAVEPGKLVLKPGGSARLVLTGQGLDTVENFEVLFRGQTTGALQIRPRSRPSPTRLDLLVSAGLRATSGSYAVRAQSAAGTLNLPVSISVP